jgi:transforming growth factor-beta-induced protein
MRTHSSRTGRNWRGLKLATASVVALSLVAAACGGEDDSAAVTTVAPETTAAAATDDGDDMADDDMAGDDMADDDMADEGMDDEGMDDDMEAEGASLPTDQFGPACEAIPEDPDDPGSSEGMAQDPAATAASNNPELSTLVELVGEADLVDTINGLDGATIFAPSNDAFDALAADDPETFEAVAGDVDLLTTVLTYHVIGDQELDAQGLADAGTATTVAEQDLSFSAEGEEVTVEAAGSEAMVACGNVETANATVHIVDYVLVPDVG